MMMQWLLDTVLGPSENELRRQRIEIQYQQDQAKLHPWERDVPWPGLETGHLPAPGTRLGRFELSKAPIFGKRQA